MLSIRIFQKNLTYNLKQPLQQLNANTKLLIPKDLFSSASSSSSSDSSDSDSDKEQKQEKIQTTETTDKILNTSNTTQNEPESISQILLKTKRFNVASNFRKPEKNKKAKTLSSETEYRQKLSEAAKRVATALKDDKVEGDLLNKLLNLKKSDESEKVSETTEEPASVDLKDLLLKMKVSTKKPLNAPQLDQYNEPSLTNKLLRSKLNTSRQRHTSDPQTVSVKKLDIFKKESINHLAENNILSTWRSLEEKETKLAILRTPKNIFEELILWTEEGKLWHFPINNEQGMEREKNVHFSEHVFMERHLKGWCPKQGPIRHFMELVCVGLSKNSYFTVEEKVGHIQWYQNYFEERKDLIRELGLLDEPSNATQISKSEDRVES